MHFSSWEHKDGADELAITKIGRAVLGGSEPEGAAVPYVDGWRQTDRPFSSYTSICSITCNFITNKW